MGIARIAKRNGARVYQRGDCMTNQERSSRDVFGPLTFMAGLFEIIAVVLFIVMIFEWSRGPLDD